MTSSLGRVLMLTPDAGHLDRRIAQEAATLAARGWRVDIYPSHAPIDPATVVLARGVQMLARPVQPALAGIRRAKRLLRTISPRLHGIADVAQSSFTDRANQIADWNIGHLTSLAPYDAVFAHDIPALPLALRLGDAWGCAVICDLHEVYPQSDDGLRSPRIRAYWERVEADCLRRVDGIVCVNSAVEAYVRERYAPSVAVGVVHNSVPFAEPAREEGRIHRIFGIQPEARVLVFAGSLRPDTNLQTLISGFSESGLGGWVLAVLGSGPLQATLEEIVRGREAEGRVFLGHRVPQHELVATLASADAGALPYQPVGYNHLISTPNKLFEYIQARLPIAATRLPMIERIITANGNGAFVDYSTPATTALGLRQFVAEDLPGFGPETLEDAARNVSWEHDEGALLNVFEAALAQAARRREQSSIAQAGSS